MDKAEQVIKQQGVSPTIRVAPGIKMVELTTTYFIPKVMASWEILDKMAELFEHDDEVPSEELGDILLWLVQEYRVADYRELHHERARIKRAAAWAAKPGEGSG
jgi:hypothetical protein